IALAVAVSASACPRVTLGRVCGSACPGDRRRWLRAPDVDSSPVRRLLGGYLIGVGLRVGYRLISSGALTLDLGIGRRVQPLGSVVATIAAPREVVFDVIAAPYLGRTPRALADKLQVWERGSDMVLAAHFTPVKCGVATTVETVRFERPERIDF